MSVRIYVGDVRTRLRDLDDNSIDMAVTSPPYWGLRDYGYDGQIGLEPTLGQHLDVMVEVFDLVRAKLKPEGSLWLNYGDCYATTPNGRSAADTKAMGDDDRTFCDKPMSTIGPIRRSIQERSNGGEGQHFDRRGGILKPKDLCMIPNRLAIALQDVGWWVRSEIIWGKPNPMPDSSGRYRPSTAHEKLFLLTKSAKSYYDETAVMMPAADSTASRLAQDVASQIGSTRANGGTKLNGNMKAVGDGETRLLRNYEPDLSGIILPEVWDIATSSFSEAHFATFPPTLVQPCIQAGCPPGGVVLDPFGGAGTTAMVADRLGRDSILIEGKPEYVEMTVARLRNDGGMFCEVTIL